MEPSTESNSYGNLGAPSHDTALCIIPPQTLWPAINRLRSLNDKAYAKWPPHINLVYPFVHPGVLADAAEILSHLDLSSLLPIQASIVDADTFLHNKYNTLYLKPNVKSTRDLHALSNYVRSALGWQTQPHFQPHMTVGQSEDADSDTHKFLLNKARLLAPISWDIAQLAIMVRDSTPGATDGLRRMKVWKCLDLESKTLIDENLPQDEVFAVEKNDHPQPSKAYTQIAYQFDAVLQLWRSADNRLSLAEPTIVNQLIVASYNVLAEFCWPPDTSRTPSLVSNLLSRRAEADILVLQEVSDHFLPCLLQNEEFRAKYPYSTHGPPDQPEIGPLPSLLNIVILSKFPMRWEYLPLQRRHKGAAVATFPTVCFRDVLSGANTKPLIVAGCHFTQGLTDGALSSKKVEILRLQRHIAEHYGSHPAVIAGDFNVTTSSYAIDMSQKSGALSVNGRQCLDDIHDMLSNADLHDVWLATKVAVGESSEVSQASEAAVMDLYEGEQGATFNPLENKLAEKLVGCGADKRPQRYDRILCSAQLPLRPTAFNMFGKDLMVPNEEGKRLHASDHWGVRCLFTENTPVVGGSTVGGILDRVKTIELHEAQSSLGGFEDLKQALLAHGHLPTEQDERTRKEALSLLETVLLGNDLQKSEHESRATPVGLVLVPVGSFGMGVWMSSSDVDCLCIGTISSKTFFGMALQRLRKASDRGVRVLRKVLANTGTMLELNILGIKFDLQYSAATSIVEKFPAVMNLPSNHPEFALPVQTLAKLKPARDMYYLLRSIPDLAQFRVAFLLIKAWAISRGLYGARFGLLGGIHISVLLVPICKQLATLARPASSSSTSTADIVTTFFRHYANVDWATQVVLDPFFHKELRYHRTSREPLCLLGWHAPSLNTAMTASVPTVRLIAAEIEKTDALLSQPGVTWDSVLGSLDAATVGVQDFLQNFKSYVKIDARFWGSSPSKGRKFFGWLESRCIAILIDMNRKAPALLPRMWPGRFIEAPAAETAEDTEPQGFYLIGLAWHCVDGERAKDDMKATKLALDGLLRDFGDRMRSDGRYYDAASCWMSASVVNANDVLTAVLAPGYLDGIDGIAADSDDLDDDSDEEEEEVDEDDEEQVAASHEYISSASRSKSRPAKLNVPTSAKPQGMGRFRPAAEVLSRLRWDRALDAADFIVGFEDRFAGAQEKALAQWKTEQTDEEFIPQHRILYFKRRSDGRIVWERKTRIDRIFGSGVVPADAELG